MAWFRCFCILISINNYALGGLPYANYLDDEIVENVPSLEESLFRIARQYPGRYGAGGRFAWQNPVIVAPTLAPVFVHQPNPTIWTRPWTPATARPTGGQYPAGTGPLIPSRFPSLTYPTIQNRFPPTTPPPYYPNPPTPRRQFPSLRPYSPISTPRLNTLRPVTEYYQELRPVQRQSTTRRPPSDKFVGGERLPEMEAQTQQRCPSRTRKGKRNGKCYPLGSNEPCSENMVFYEDPTNPEFGQCDCMQNTNRPLVYHQQTDKCYFVFQQVTQSDKSQQECKKLVDALTSCIIPQAYCKPGEWLILDPEVENRPFCDINRCISWTQTNVSSNWDWTSNGPQLDSSGPVALLRERSCAVLGGQCSQEGRENLKQLLELGATLPQSPQRSLPRLIFSQEDLVCGREVEKSEFQTLPELDLKIACKSGMINKWKLEGR